MRCWPTWPPEAHSATDGFPLEGHFPTREVAFGVSPIGVASGVPRQVAFGASPWVASARNCRCPPVTWEFRGCSISSPVPHLRAGTDWCRVRPFDGRRARRRDRANGGFPLPAARPSAPRPAGHTRSPSDSGPGGGLAPTADSGPSGAPISSAAAGRAALAQRLRPQAADSRQRRLPTPSGGMRATGAAISSTPRGSCALAQRLPVPGGGLAPTVTSGPQRRHARQRCAHQLRGPRVVHARLATSGPGRGLTPTATSGRKRHRFTGARPRPPGTVGARR